MPMFAGFKINAKRAAVETKFCLRPTPLNSKHHGCRGPKTILSLYYCPLEFVMIVFNDCFPLFWRILQYV